jgi:hypothetical protein
LPFMSCCNAILQSIAKLVSCCGAALYKQINLSESEASKRPKTSRRT